MISVTSNADRVSADLRAYIQETGVSDQEGVRMASKSVTGFLLQDTPPIKSLSPGESFASQRTVGEFAVKRDLRRSFKALEDLKIMTDPKKPLVFRKVQKALEKNDSSLLATLLSQLKYPGITADRIVEAATPELHNSLRVKGRVPPRSPSFFVFKKPSIAALEKELLEAIGRGKAGWLAAGYALGIKVPQWISRHGAPGSTQDMLARAVNPSFLGRNNVAYIADFAIQNRLVELALEREAGSLERQLAAKRAGAWKRFRGRS